MCELFCHAPLTAVFEPLLRCEKIKTSARAVASRVHAEKVEYLSRSMDPYNGRFEYTGARV